MAPAAHEKITRGDKNKRAQENTHQATPIRRCFALIEGPESRYSRQDAPHATRGVIFSSENYSGNSSCLSNPYSKCRGTDPYNAPSLLRIIRKVKHYLLIFRRDEPLAGASVWCICFLGRQKCMD